ncbi:group II truncated hemoglobin [Methylicorpusculum sp.]|uniref:group II truncated hemoglobin n=1 Tax=Methylicorpusculum sp. TaxID=2713644 RepID=UPI00271E8407|nr:group II truncated hemoglobin [Methylicorpusculum sp.]MDO8843538.1 group II truncated hemoglobin [Methylicorpusculum sp.]
MSATPTITPYQLVGGEQGIQSLVDRFYFFMDTLPEARGIRAIHQKNLNGARDKLFKFLSGWLGGPDLFVEQYGHPRLRMRHFSFEIGSSERDQWMFCMNKALNELPLDPEFRENLSQALQELATHMINKDE